MANLRFGTAGVPHTAKKRDSASGIKRVRELGLDHMELEFVHGVKMSEDTAKIVGEAAKESDVSLTIHGPYYINLAATDKKIWYASINRIIQSAKIGEFAGVKSVTFHSGFLNGMDEEANFDTVKLAIEKIYAEIGGFKVRIAPELTGKASQFGDLKILIRMAQVFESQNLGFCFDFSHKFARSNGGFNTYEEFISMLSDIEKGLGHKFLENMHIHLSGMNYGEKGEKNHLTFLPSLKDYEKEGVKIPGIEEIDEYLTGKNKMGGNPFNWQDCLKALKKMEVGGYVVTESPNLEQDALLLKKYYESL
jgi:deoxyribonuclease IV